MMKLGNAAAMVVLGATLAAAPAAAQQISPVGGGNFTGSGNETARQLFNRLAGEWEGTLEAHRTGSSSISVVGASNRVEENGVQLVSTFDGFIFGNPLQGACIFKAGERFTTASVNGLFTHPARGNFTVNQQGNGFTFSFDANYGGRPQRFEQTFLFVGSDQYQVEWRMVQDNGSKTPFMSMQMNRLYGGQRSAATGSFESQSVAKVRESIAAFAQAGVNESR